MDLAVSRNPATQAHLNNIANILLDQINQPLVCSAFFFGLYRYNSTSDPQGTWYWTDGVKFNPINFTDERYSSSGLSVPQHEPFQNAFGYLAYRKVTSNSTVICDLWFGVLPSFNYSLYSVVEIPSKLCHQPFVSNMFGQSHIAHSVYAARTLRLECVICAQGEDSRTLQMDNACNVPKGWRVMLEAHIVLCVNLEGF
jgi:hypothetical protein